MAERGGMLLTVASGIVACATVHTLGTPFLLEAGGMGCAAGGSTRCPSLSGKKWEGKREAGGGTASGVASGSGPSQLSDEQGDCLRWSLVPSNGVLRSNYATPTEGENDLAHTKYVVMVRPTHDRARDKAGDYPYSWHLHGRRRLWEVRVQLRFKVKPTSELYFGLEMLPGPKNTSQMVTKVQAVLLAAIGKTIGKEFYHTSGDDPATTTGEVEPPAFAMPFWAVDQFIVSPAGEEPELQSNLEGKGIRRTDGMEAYVSYMRKELADISTEKVYTLCFWGVSQFLDVVNWQFKGLIPFVTLDMNAVCGTPPIYVEAYQLKGNPPKGARHYNSQKDVFFKVAMWSTRANPDQNLLCDLLGDGIKLGAENSATDLSPTTAAFSPTSPEGSERRRPRFLQKVAKMISCSPKTPSSEPSSRRKETPKWAKMGQKFLGGCMGG
eukprot:CAMPEP_0206516662 /NCGR_PEP_ID=MMETSP0324_2-20121206/63497_1 /ASSEMBLY_ACC=CAM_ASM_000836 /TAXON_ID=2866 /ORGANISM="Crypthecodinium cohnii, Strain Seligo" /LENGTH=437 /DNA_ID=CAMNT_0054009631 /DNA_START=187 /DNA_END=1501 /DNA_ORIENTATION=-